MIFTPPNWFVTYPVPVTPPISTLNTFTPPSWCLNYPDASHAFHLHLRTDLYIDNPDASYPSHFHIQYSHTSELVCLLISLYTYPPGGDQTNPSVVPLVP